MIKRAFLAAAPVAWVLGAIACTNGEGNEANVLPEVPGGSSSTAGPSGSSGETGGESEVCDAYLRCAADLTPEIFETLLDTYGPSGTCWAGGDAGAAELCVDSCEAGLQSLEDGFGEEACDQGASDRTPVTYRFDCIDIQMIGDADSTVIQAQILGNTWGSDIDQFKLNILLEVASRDAEAGEAMLGILSGVGPDAAGQCAQSETVSDLIPVTFAASETRWGPGSAVGECSAPTSGSDGVSYQMELPPDRVVYIYSEDNDETPFNCTPAGGTPDAVPIRAVRAEVSTDASEGLVWGTLNGCLLEAEAQGLCSCLGACAGMGPDDLQTEGVCAGCPVGGTPLAVLLGGVNPSENCSSIMGEPAFDLLLGFSGVALPHVPTACE
ncbi:MAG: hypothetical protein KUG77_06970 [Nannocystaceae bacterium]|nr:hypothetical protein [Nannocystaceae bacterium]